MNFSTTGREKGDPLIQVTAVFTVKVFQALIKI